MKVFNFTNGRKAELVADLGSWAGCGDGLINGKLTGNNYSGKFNGYEFHNSFQVNDWSTGKRVEVNITPADFAAKFGAGVEAVCFCIGHNLNLDKWEWCYCASHQWLVNHNVRTEPIKVDWANFSGDLSKLNLGPVSVNDPF